MPLHEMQIDHEQRTRRALRKLVSDNQELRTKVIHLLLALQVATNKPGFMTPEMREIGQRRLDEFLADRPRR